MVEILEKDSAIVRSLPERNFDLCNNFTECFNCLGYFDHFVALKSARNDFSMSLTLALSTMEFFFYCISMDDGKIRLINCMEINRS